MLNCTWTFFQIKYSYQLTGFLVLAGGSEKKCNFGISCFSFPKKGTICCLDSFLVVDTIIFVLKWPSMVHCAADCLSQ